MLNKAHAFSIVSVVAMLAAPAASRADYVENLNIFQIGDTRTGPVTLDWNHFYDGSQAPEDTVTLEIVAEGIDSNGPNGLEEDDQVFFNGTLLGLLTHQLFYSADFNIKAGQGALGFPDTELSTSVFNVNPGLLQVGNNLVQIVVDPANWIMEAETSSLRVTAAAIPEPGTWTLLLIGLAGLVLVRRWSSGNKPGAFV